MKVQVLMRGISTGRGYFGLMAFDKKFQACQRINGLNISISSFSQGQSCWRGDDCVSEGQLHTPGPL